MKPHATRARKCADAIYKGRRISCNRAVPGSSPGVGSTFPSSDGLCCAAPGVTKIEMPQMCHGAQHAGGVCQHINLQ